MRLGPGVPPPARPAPLRVRLLDVTHVDAAADVVAEQVVPGAVLDGAAGVAFELRAGAVDPSRDYIVEAHLETGGGGKVHPGDYLSMESYPVLTHGAPDRVTVEVLPV